VTRFSLQDLVDAVEDETRDPWLVLIEEIPGDDVHVFDAYHLDLGADLVSQFRSNQARSLGRWPPEDEWDRYVEGWVPEEGQFAAGEVDALNDSPLLRAIDEGTRPERVRRPAVGPGEERRARGYAIVFPSPADVAPDPVDRIYLVRRHDPIQHLDRGHLTAIWQETRLTLARSVLGFDSGIDVVVWRESVVIRSLAAFEALFFPSVVRAAAAERAAEELNDQIPIQNLDHFVGTARGDSIFAGRLRRLARSPAFPQLSVDRVRASLRRFGLAHRFMSGNELVFDSRRRWRWPFLAALEDGLVESPGSGQLYQSTSQRPWPRRRVTAVVREDDGITAIRGDDWAAVSVATAAQEIEDAQCTYFLGDPDDPVEVLPLLAETGMSVYAPGAHGEDQLSSLPESARSDTDARERGQPT